MELKINGLEKLAVNYFEQIIIQENLSNIEINIIGGDNTESKGDFLNKFNQLSDDDKIILIIKRYIENFKINGVTKLPPIVRGCSQEAIVYGSNSDKQLKMKLYNPKYKNISNMIMNKFINDRYVFFWNNDIKRIVIEASSNVMKYEKCDDYVRLVVKTDSLHNILNTEKKFIGELINYMFSKESENIIVNKIYSSSSYDAKGVLAGYNVQCGDMSFTFPNNYCFSFLFGIIDSYINKINLDREDIKKRQLKLEGF